MKKYERYEAMLGGRNSFSKTDHDATFMRMKEDHLRNRSVKPGYNVQIGTEDQLIVGFSLHQNPADSPTLLAHLRQLKQNLGKVPPVWIADAGYGCEENYQILEAEGITSYVKYRTFERENSKRRKQTEKEKYRVQQFKYDERMDAFRCPENKQLVYEKKEYERSATGYVSEKRVYRCQDCEGCAVREKCTSSKYGRTIRFSPKLERLKRAAFERLTTAEGKKMRSRRGADVEAVFGLLKGNKKFRRFHLRGLEKVEVEWGLLSIAHNLSKIAIA
jgi:hypothetical protein